MRKEIFAGASALALGVLIAAGSASAADLSVVSPPEAMPGSAPIINWTGFHIGAHGGYGWAQDAASFANGNPGAIGVSPNGVLAGVQVGYDWQFASGLVAGIEADASASGLFGYWAGPGASGGNSSIYDRVTGFGSVRARLGFATGRWLPYVTAGWAWAQNTRHSEGTLGGGYNVTGSASHSGWTAGVGLEYAINEHWSARGQVLYADLGTRNYPSGPPGGTNVHLTTTVATLGVNYRF